MTNKVHMLPNAAIRPNGEPNPHVVELLEDLLSRAKSGEIVSLQATGFCSNDDRYTVWAHSTAEDIYATVGAIEWLKQEYIHRHGEALD